MVEGQVSALEDLQVLFERLWVAAEAFGGHALDRLPNSPLVVPADRWRLFAIESVRDIFIAVVRVRPSALLPLALDLVQQRNILVKLYKAQEADEAIDDVLFEVDLHSESPLHVTRGEDVLLLLRIRRLVHHLHCEWVLIGIVVEVYEAIVEEEACVALLTIRVEDLLATLDVLERLDDEALPLVGVCPAGLARALVVQHIGVRHEAIGLHTLYLDAKDATGDHHSNLRVLLQRELTIVGHFVADRVVVLLDIADFLADLLLERASLEPCSLFLRVEDGEVIESLGQNVDVLVEERALLAALLHDVGCQEGVLRRYQSFAVPSRVHLRSDRGLLSHLKCDDFVLGDVEDCFALLDVA